MKPAAFAYFAPTSIDEALALMAEHGWDAKPLAGGQSLVPTMNFRLTQPAVLVDLNGVEELFFLRENPDSLSIGAMTRQRTVERSPLVAQHAPLIHEAMPHIAHAQIRNRGTFGGSLAHADPAAELPALAVALNARMNVRSSQQDRWIEAREFYVGLFAADIQPDELLVEVQVPKLASGTGWAFDEVARQHGNYALCGAAAIVGLGENGQISQATLVFFSVGEGPVEATQAQQMLVGEKPTPDLILAATETAGNRDIDPVGDIHAGPAYRRHLAKVLGKRVLTRAVARADRTAVDGGR